jgi:hypothetical protein
MIHCALSLGFSLWLGSTPVITAMIDQNGVLSICNILVLVLMYSIIPANHLLYNQTHAMQVSPSILAIYMMLPVFASFHAVWKSHVIRLGVVVVDFVLTKVVLIAILTDMIDINTDFS